jgi:hypothetical protein
VLGSPRVQTMFDPENIILRARSLRPVFEVKQTKVSVYLSNIRRRIVDKKGKNSAIKVTASKISKSKQSLSENYKTNHKIYEK